jgi:hypothetical protein
MFGYSKRNFAQAKKWHQKARESFFQNPGSLQLIKSSIACQWFFQGVLKGVASNQFE